MFSVTEGGICVIITNYLSTKLSLPIVVSFCLIITFVVVFLIVNYAFKIKFLDKAYNAIIKKNK